MKQLLRELLRGEIKRIDIDEKYEVETIRGNMIPVEVKGTIANEGGKLIPNLLIKGVENTSCDRCLCETSYEYYHIYSETIEEIDAFDLLEVASEEITLENPAQILCMEDCKGICPNCGANLNEEECHCKQGKIDSRFGVLEQLLNE